MTCTQSPSELWNIEAIIIYNPIPVVPSITNLTVTEFYNITINNARYRNLCATYQGNNGGLMGTNCSNSSDQIFTVISNHDNTYLIKHVVSGLVWEIQNQIKDNGTPVWSNSRNSTITGQKFTITNINNTWTITNTLTSKCVDMDCRTFKIDQWDCSRSASQRWIFSNYSIIPPTPQPIPTPIPAPQPVPTPQPTPSSTTPGRLTVTVDNTLVKITVNGNAIPLTGSGDVTNWGVTKTYALAIRSGDLLEITGLNTGGPAGIIATLLYNDSTGTARTLNTDTTWTCGGKAAISLGKNGANPAWTKFDAIDPNAQWLWNSLAQVAGDTTSCSVVIS